MNEQLYNDQALNEYLLGTLSAAEVERFDELSFTDEEFADVLSAAEKDLVDGYVRGELAGATLERFESYYLASDMRRRKVEFARNFQAFAEKNIAANKHIVAVESEPKRNLTAILAGIFTTPRPSLKWSFALATLALMIFGGWLFIENSRPPNQTGETAVQRTPPEEREKQLREESAAQNNTEAQKEAELARVREELAQIEKERQQKQITDREQQQRELAEQKQVKEQKRVEEQKQIPAAPRSIIASFVLTPQLRGGSLQTLAVPAKTDAVAMRLELESNDYAAYRVALRNPADNKILWQSGKIKSRSVGENKALNLQFPANLLKPQTYILEVSGIADDGAAQVISDYPFRVVR